MAQKRMSVNEVANDKADRVMNAVATWCSYYRANPHRFCKDYLNIDLHPFQMILIYMMNLATNFCFIGSRGLGKTYLTAVFLVVRCILWPHTKAVVAAKTRSQGTQILEKITKELMPNSGLLRGEIKDVIINQSNAQITFRNGSYIEVVTANDNSRGHRANLLVCDEFRMIDKDVIDLVLRRFLTVARQPGYLKKKEYKHLIERPKEMYLSSSWFQSHWSWQLCKDYFVSMLDSGKKYFCFRFPYQMPIKEGMLAMEQVEDEMSESSFSDIKFRMEMEAMFIGATDGGLFSFDDINKIRNIKKPFYAPNVILGGKDFVPPAKKPGEKRILTADIALMSSKHNDNDATSIFLNSLVPDSSGRCTSNMVYTENCEGIITQDLVLKLRRYFKWFDCDYIGIDAKGLGAPIMDLLMHECYDPETGETYPPLNCCNNPDFQERCPDKTAPKVIWAIMGSAQLNNDATIALRSGIQQGRIRFLESEYDCEDLLRKEIKGYDKLTPTEKTALQLPFINTGLMVNELVNLEYEATNNVIKVHEKPGARKDRYSSVSYNYYIAQQVERSMAKNYAKSKKIEINFRAPNLRRGSL